MPATFPSHPGVVLPLKLWWPRWFDGVALAAGAASPDLAYLLDGSGLPVWPFSHELWGLVGWCLPATAALCWLFRRAAPAVAAHLPKGGVFALRDYGALSARPPAWWVTVWSALLGALSHIGFDRIEDLGGGTEPWLHLAGALGCLVVLAKIGRDRLILRWHGPAPRVPRRPWLFWCSAMVVFAAGVVTVPMLPAAFLVHTTGVRLIAVVALALLAGAAIARRGVAGAADRAG